MQFFPLTERIHSSSILRRGVEYEICVEVRSGRGRLLGHWSGQMLPLLLLVGPNSVQSIGGRPVPRLHCLHDNGPSVPDRSVLRFHWRAA